MHCHHRDLFLIFLSSLLGKIVMFAMLKSAHFFILLNGY